MATTVASRKQKGRRLQQSVRDKILELFPDLTERDVMSAPMGVTGEDIILSEKANLIFPYAVECKNQEKLNIWNALQKMEQENRRECGILVFKRNNSKTYAALDVDTLLRLIKCQK